MKGTCRWLRWPERFFDRRSFWIVALPVLLVVVTLLFSPILGTPFQGDDFRYVHFLHFNFQSMLKGQDWVSWLANSSGYAPWSYFRPVFQFSYLLDYLVWGLNPIGYHLTNLGLHVLTVFLVYLLCQLLTHQRLAAGLAGFLFAIMPIHVEAVAYFGARADELVTFWFVLALVFFVLFRRSSRVMFLLASLGALGFSLLAKESAVALPPILLAYDWIYNRGKYTRIRDMLRTHLVIWCVLGAYILFRATMWLQTRSFGNTGALLELGYFSQAFVLALADPFLQDMTTEIFWTLMALAGVGLLVYRSRSEIWLGIVWITVTILPSFLSLDGIIADRYVYLSSVGLAILLSSIISKPLPRLPRLSQAVGLVLFVVVSAAYTTGVVSRREAWSRVAQIAQIVPQQVMALHPILPADARLIFTNVPVLVGGRMMPVFAGKLGLAMQLAYNNPDLEVYDFGKFPIWLDKLDRTFLFEYNQRKIIERADLLRALKLRTRCDSTQLPSVAWEFTNGLQGWESWNQLTDLKTYEGNLTTQSLGNDPYMASPPLEIPAIAIGDVEIIMRVQAKQATSEGSVYWLATGQQDFSPALKVSFVVRADGEFHTYRANIGQSGQLLLGDHILRLRFDPVDIPADIAIRTIRVYAHCSSVQNDPCQCTP